MATKSAETLNKIEPTRFICLHFHKNAKEKKQHKKMWRKNGLVIHTFFTPRI